MSFFLTLFLTAAMPTQAHARQTIDLAKVHSVRIHPELDSGRLGRVSSVGDVNGDGIPDALIGACGAAHNGTGAGAVYVVFGRATPGDIRLGEPGFGFRIDGSAGVGACIPGEAGDVNGDGLGDIIVGAPTGDRAYVVFGKADHDRVDLRLFDMDLHLGAGFRIDGAFGGGITGSDVDGIGDVNGDGRADVVISAPFNGTTYVVFGKADGERVELRDLHEETEPSLVEQLLGEDQNPVGYRIDTPEPRVYGKSYSAAGAGDVNGDGIPDVVIGVSPRIRAAGRAFVVYGKASSTPIDVTEMGPSRGFKIKSHAKGNAFGDAVDGAGDVNGDGYDDVVVGASGRGSAYVIFGDPKRSKVDVKNLGASGFRVWYPADDEKSRHRADFGFAVAGVGDVNRDGFADVAVGAGLLHFRGRPAAGGAYVVFGSRRAWSGNVSELPRTRGFLIGGGQEGDTIGYTLAGVSDVDGDRVPDLMLNGRDNAFLVFLPSK